MITQGSLKCRLGFEHAHAHGKERVGLDKEAGYLELPKVAPYTGLHSCTFSGRGHWGGPVGRDKGLGGVQSLYLRAGATTNWLGEQRGLAALSPGLICSRQGFLQEAGTF